MARGARAGARHVPLARAGARAADALGGDGHGAAEEAPGPAHSNKEIDGAIRAAVARVLGSRPFAVDLVDEWCNQILEHSIKQGSPTRRWTPPPRPSGTPSPTACAA